MKQPTFVLTVDLSNDAFTNDPKYELRRIFKRLVVGDALRDVDPTDHRYGANQGTVRDTNGNTVGQWAIFDDSPDADFDCQICGHPGGH